MHFARSSSLLAATLVISACAAPGDDGLDLPNSNGKDDSAAIRLRLTDSSSVVGLSVGCDQPHGCEGFIGVKIKSPAPCALFPNEPRCGIGRTDPLTFEALTVTIESKTEGRRVLPLRVETGDGEHFNTEIAAAFSALADEEVEVSVEKAAGTPDLMIELRAEWKASADPGASAAEIQTFLGTVPGLTFQEVGTSYPGYRAFSLTYAQPLDHANPAAGSIPQAMVLHHRQKDAPMVLYTSGYDLFTVDYLSELGEALQGNQLSTEQRMFGTSRPAGMTVDAWRYVNIEQAAKDHHRIVQALRPFYDGSWLSTGHSKGGMTSVFHRRMFPDDVAATVAYVAPISYANPDPRYVPFLDTIGEEACRKAVRAVQRNALLQFDQLMPLAVSAGAGQTFVRAGGQESAFEKGIVLIEWLFWQHYGIEDCGQFLSAPTDPAGLFALVSSLIGGGFSDQSVEPSVTYYYQAETQLGMQDFSKAHLSDLLRHEATPFDWSPAGTTPVHNKAAMTDIQSWVKSSAKTTLFLYGQYDPWTGGAFEIGTRADVVKLVAPKATHGAMLRSLTGADQVIALDKIATWIGSRPNLGTPRGAARPALPLLR